jgi:hypothetical protein
VLVIWLTHLSEFETFDALDDREFEESGMTMHRTLGILLGEHHHSGIGELVTPDESSPIVRMWQDHEPYLFACQALFAAERAGRLAAPMRVSTLPMGLRSGEAATALRPSWRDDLDVLRSHRSNLARRYPKSYPKAWSRGDMALWPYLFPFSDEDGTYDLMISKAERDLLKSGDRKLPKSVRKRVYNI